MTIDGPRDHGSSSRIEPPADEWSVDNRIVFDTIHIIESISDEGYSARTGLRLHEELESLCASTPARALFHPVVTADDLWRVLIEVTGESRAGAFPLLHFETHGAERPAGAATVSPGLCLASGEFAAWADLAPHLIAINEATRLNLVVFFAACYGFDVLSAVRLLEQPAPARILIGPFRDLSFGEIETAAKTFYRTLFRERNGTSAARAVNEELKSLVLLAISAEELFLELLKGYFNDFTNEERIAARTEAIVAPLVLAGLPADLIEARRRWVRIKLADRKGVFEQAYRHFFFIDRHPEIAQRFIMSYERCFESVAVEP